ncbi:MAG: phospholipase D-like domain-containing protein [Thiolinea sp.]
MPSESTQLLDTARQGIDQWCHTPVRNGNQIQLLASGVASYEQRWKLIQQAKHSIHIVAFSMMLDQTSIKLRDMLLEKLKQGVEVKLIFDDAVMWSTFSGGIVRDLRRAGAEVIRYHKLFRHLLPHWEKGHPFRQSVQIFKHKLKRRFHEKYLIVDGEIAILGGINWGNKYAFGGLKPKAWRDSDTLITGPVVSDIQRQFHRDFDRYLDMDRYLAIDLGHALPDAGIEHEIPELTATGKDQVRYVAHKPYDDNELVMTNAYLALIQKAEKYIYWGCHGTRPPNVIAGALTDAAQRGVDVRLYTNSRHASQTLMLFGLMGWMYRESQRHFRGLLQGGVRVFEWQKPGAFHSKNMVIDDVFAAVGSYNIARGSTFHHTESNVFVTGGEFPLAVRKQFEIDEQDCAELTLKSVPAPGASTDPYQRPLNPRNQMVAKSLLPTMMQGQDKNDREVA